MEGFAVRRRGDRIDEKLAGIEGVGEELRQSIGRHIVPMQWAEPFESLVEVSHFMKLVLGWWDSLVTTLKAARRMARL